MATYPWQQKPIVEKFGNVSVVREDLIEGGSKIRFLPNLLNRQKEIVYASPADGGAQLALSVVGRELGIKVHLFYAARKELNRRQSKAKANGAQIHLVGPMGYISHVRSDAKKFAAKIDAWYLPIGFDVPEAEDPFVEVMEKVKKKIGQPDVVWCVTSTGMMARCLGKAFPDSQIAAVSVGMVKTHEKQDFSSNVILIESGFKDLATCCKVTAPFPICPNYESKAWRLLLQAQERDTKQRALFWNVIGSQ